MQKLKITVNEHLAGNSAFMSFLESLPNTFAQEGTIVHNRRNVLRIIDVQSLDIDVKEVMVKRFHGLFFFQKIIYSSFRKPKCRKAYDNTAELRRRGIEAAPEKAVVEVWNHGLFQYAFYVSAVGTGERLDNLVIDMQERNSQTSIRQVIRQYAAFLNKMHERGILYMDMNCGNVLCRQSGQGQGWEFCLIDTNRARLFEETKHLSVEEAMPDLILMNPKMGTVELFIEDYLKVRGCYSPEEVQRIRQIQRKRHEKKRPLKSFFKRYKKAYYKWLEG